MKLGLSIGYSGAELKLPVDKILLAERLGFDSVWTAEAYGSDAITPLAYLAALTKRIRLGTGIMQLAARPPASAAMAAGTVDALAGGGRVIAGLGVSGPQIVEGWYGQPWGKPYWRIRDYVAIMRKVFERKDPVAHEGREISLPYTGPGATGVGKPLVSILHMNPRPADLARHRHRGQREADGGGRRRLAAAGLRAAADADAPALAGGRLPARRRRQGLRRLRDPGPRRGGDHRRRQGHAGAHEAAGGALRRRHGPSRQELPQGDDDPPRLRRRRPAHPGAVPRPSARTRPSPPSPTSSATRWRWSGRWRVSASATAPGPTPASPGSRW